MLGSILLAYSSSGSASGTYFACTPVAVYDGDGPIWCEEGPKLRLQHIAARDIDGKCKPGHPCPDAADIEARGALVSLLGGRGAPWAQGTS